MLHLFKGHDGFLWNEKERELKIASKYNKVIESLMKL